MSILVNSRNNNVQNNFFCVRRPSFRTKHYFLSSGISRRTSNQISLKYYTNNNIMKNNILRSIENYSNLVKTLPALKIYLFIYLFIAYIHSVLN